MHNISQGSPFFGSGSTSDSEGKTSERDGNGFDESLTEKKHDV